MSATSDAGARDGERPTRVVIADDHPPQRAGVRACLEDAGFVVVAEAGSAEAAVEAVEEHVPDLALLDVNMPGDGVRAAERIIARSPGTAVVMITVSSSDEDVFRALRAGAHGYLPKDIEPARLAQALRGVLAGEAAIPRTLVRRVLEEFGGRQRRRLKLPGGRGANLTEREWEVLEHLHDGATTASIAKAMGVSPVTVRTHVSALLRKLRVPDRASAARLLDDR